MHLFKISEMLITPSLGINPNLRTVSSRCAGFFLGGGSRFLNLQMFRICRAALHLMKLSRSTESVCAVINSTTVAFRAEEMNHSSWKRR